MKYSSSIPIAAPVRAMMPQRMKAGMGEVRSFSGMSA
jgi:hypothetical protein